MKKILFLFLSLVCTLFGSVQAQDKLIFSNPVPSNTWFYMGEVLTVSVNVQFIDEEEDPGASYPINTVSFTYTVNDAPSSILSVESPVANLFHGQSTTLDINIPIISGLFTEGGGHVIIIWPVISIPIDIAPDSLELAKIIHVYQKINSASINEPDALSIGVYPNPTSDLLQVNLPADAELSLYTMDGRRVFHNREQSLKRTLDLTTLPAGAYLVEITSPTVSQRQFVIKR